MKRIRLFTENTARRAWILMLVAVVILNFGAKAQTVNLQDGLVAFYPFDGNANDVSTFGYNGTVYGATPVADRHGNPNCAYSFDGVDDYIEMITNNLNFPLGTSFSISLWVKAQPQATTQVTDCYETATINYGMIFDKYGCPYGLDGNLIQLFQRNGELIFSLSGNQVNGNFYPPHNGISIVKPIDYDNWIFVTLIKNSTANTMSLYINATLATTSTFQDDAINTPVPLFFGKQLICNGCPEPASAAFFNGVIDQFRVYNRVLNAAEIQALYTEGDATCPNDRYALMTLYNATNGANWTNNTNWGTNEPLNTWFGITTNEDGCVTGIDLNNNNLVGTLPSEFDNLPSLLILKLQYNQLSGTIPNFNNLPNLLELWLAFNQFDGSIPDFGNFSKLTSLWLESNQLSGTIPDFTNLPSLTGLDISNNQITGSIPNFTNLANLGMLVLKNNQLNNIQYFSNLSNLTKLYLNANLLGIENCPVIQTLIDRGGWNAFTHSPQSNGVDFNSCIPDCIAQISTTPQTVITNNTFTIDINTSELTTNDGVISYQFDYAFAPSLIQYNNATITGTMADGGWLNVNSSNAANGQLSFSYMTSSPLQGAGSILRLEFMALDCGTSTPEITDFFFNESPACSVTNGTITVNSNGLLGDISQNGMNTAYDAALLMQYLVGSIALTACQLSVADVNCDGVVNEQDAYFILQYSNGSINEFPCTQGNKKSGNQPSYTNVEIEKNGNELEFRADDKLESFYLDIDNSTQWLGKPTFIHSNLISASNINGDVYRIVIAANKTISNDEVFMRIPLKNSTYQPQELSVRINGTPSTQQLTTGIEDTDFARNIRLYPNPATTKLNISGLTTVGETTATIFDISGRQMLTTVMNANAIDISRLQAGMYLLKLTTAEGTFTQRFVKE